jgi:hypothetical protein
MSASIDEVISTVEAARMIGIKPTTLEIWRCRGGKGPKFRKLGTSKQAMVFYVRSDVEAWIQANIGTYSSTSDYSAKSP